MFKTEFIKQWLWWFVLSLFVLVNFVFFVFASLDGTYWSPSAKVATSSMALRADMIAVARPWAIELEKQKQLHKNLIAATKKGGEGLDQIIESAEKVVVKEVTQPEICMRWGPLLVDQKQRVIDALSQWSGQWREVSRKSPVGYIVYLPAEAVQQGYGLASLTQLGVVDAFYLSSPGVLQGAISLGMFRLERRAKVHQQEMERRGLANVAIQPRLGPARNYIELRGVEQEIQALWKIYRLNPQSSLNKCSTESQSN